MTPPATILRHLFDVAVQRAQPLHTMAAYLPVPPNPALGRTLVLGAGKAAGAMAQALEVLWDAPLSGLVVTRYGHIPPRPRALQGVPQRIEIIEAAHPVPDENSVLAAQRIMALTQGLTEHDLVICLISGGGSALLTLPREGLTLADKQRINRELLNSGASISEINKVRKNISAIKGGKLAAACHPARVVTLAISDVPNDDPFTIASAPTVRDDAPNDFRLIATPQQSLEAAAQSARAAGVNAHILSDSIEGESREIAKMHAAIAKSTAAGKSAFQTPCVILSGGETTVTVQSAADECGKGGRASEFCLSLAQALQGHSGIWALAADTDGIDGTEDNAGAFVTPDTLSRAEALGLSAADYLARHDAYSYFAVLGDLLVTQPTHTNVNDFRAIWIGSPQGAAAAAG
jgi:hydroxypyruvate reductase